MEKQLEIISQAWGKQDGYAFFPWIDGEANSREERINGYHEGPAFRWPKDKDKILAHLEEHQGDDLYWCPSLFEEPRRQLDVAMDEHCLWADLDEVNPRDIDEEYKPTIAWETSPGHYQALWLIQRGYDIQGASWRGGENHRLTYYLGADPSGWDTTQLLRVPGWTNHKPQYRDAHGRSPKGKLLWYERGRRYLPDHFNDLPDVAAGLGEIKDILDEQIAGVDRHQVWGRVRLKVNKAVREYMSAREASGDRSDVLWQIERELADAGCSVVEIVALVRPTPWNKFAGRADELRRLTHEASKAIAERPEEISDQLEEEANRPKPTRLGELLKNIPKPVWIVEGIWSRGACGFIAGQPKTYKTWTSLDLAFSVATGKDFLGHFPIINPGPVLYIQEEDGLPILKQRTDKIWPGKQADRMTIDDDGSIVWESPEKIMPMDEAPIDAYVDQGFVISDPSWQSWLDETLAEGEYAMLVMDPFMMMAGDVEENRAQEMTTKVFRPLKQLSRKHNTAIVLVHHMKKGQGDGRGGQMMLGSVANHAWAEDSLYLKLSRGDVIVERESKHTTSGSFRVSNLRNQQWIPLITDERGEFTEDTTESVVRQAKTPQQKKLRVVKALEEMGPGNYTTQAIADQMSISTSGAIKALTRAQQANLVKKVDTNQWSLK